MSGYVPSGLKNDTARAIAQLVANGVTGLKLSHVTVTDQSGNVLAPIADSGLDKASRQLAFTSTIETRAQHHVEALLRPMIGPDNVRVSAAADINYGDVSRREVQYGQDPTAKHLKMSSRAGLQAGEGSGVPGSLSNQPPGNTSAPVAIDQNDQDDQANGDESDDESDARPTVAADIGDRSEKWDVEYEIDHATTVTKHAPWQLNGLSVSVVLNQSAVGNDGAWVNKIQAIIRHALNAPDLKINVAVVPFDVQQVATVEPVTWQDYLKDQSVMRAVMALLAALLILFGIAKPLARWMRDYLPVPSSRPYEPVTDDGDGQPIPPKREINRLDRAQSVARARPQEAAEMIRHWINEADGKSEGVDDLEAEQSGGSQ